MNLFFSPSGRIGRLKWWLGQLLVGAIAIFVLVPALGVLGVSLIGGSTGQGISAGGSLSALIASLVLFILFPLCVWINFCLCAKRYHDRNKPAVWFLVVFVPIIGPLWQVIECGFLAGSPGGNAYGADPSGSTGWASKVDAEIAATWQEKHDSYQYREAPVAEKKPAPKPRPTQTTVPSGFGRRGLQTQ